MDDHHWNLLATVGKLQEAHAQHLPSVAADVQALIAEVTGLRAQLNDLAGRHALLRQRLGLAYTVIRDTDQLVKQQMGSKANYEDLLLPEQRRVHHWATTSKDLDG